MKIAIIAQRLLSSGTACCSKLANRWPTGWRVSRNTILAAGLSAAVTCLKALDSPDDLSTLSDNEPNYLNRPLSYWLQKLSTAEMKKSEPPGLLSQSSFNACRELGIKAIPYILRFSYTNAAGVADQKETGEIVRNAFSVMEKVDQRKLDDLVCSGLKSSNAQVRANSVEALPLWLYDKVSADLNKLQHDVDERVRQAVADIFERRRRAQRQTIRK